MSRQKPHRWCSDKKGPDFIAIVQGIIDDDPSHSMRSITREVEVDERIVQHCVEEDICYKSYVLQRDQFISQEAKHHRLAKAKILLNRLKHLSAD